MSHTPERHETPRKKSSIHALSAFDDFTARDFAQENERPVASSPNIPFRKANANVAEEIAFSPAFSNMNKSGSPYMKPPPRTSSLPQNKNHEDAATASLSAFDDFAEEEPRQHSLRTRPTSASTMSHGASSVRSHSLQSRPASSQSSIHMPQTLPALQIKSGLDNDALEPLAEEDLDPASFDLVAPASKGTQMYSLEKQSEQLFSADHLAVIFADPLLLQRFTNFLHTYQPECVPQVIYYLNALKAIQAVQYANSLSAHLQQIEGLEFTQDRPGIDRAPELRKKAAQIFQTLADHSLAAFITQTYIQTVSITIRRRICGTLPPELREQSDGLAEVFCLTDPSRPDNPIIFASQQFNETTRYGMNHVIGRNCRFLQGPKTNPLSSKRLRQKIDAGKEHCEVFLNYRRDGLPFMNLLMIAPLIDSRGNVRYHIGAQVDVSNLVKSTAGLDSFAKLLEEENDPEQPKTLAPHVEKEYKDSSDLDPSAELQGLAEMLTLPELKVVRETGGAMHRVQQEDVQSHEAAANWSNPRVLIQDEATLDRRASDPTLDTLNTSSQGGRLAGIYSHYLLIRPYPHLRVLFASPSLRMPGMLQSKFMDRIGGSESVKAKIEEAFEMASGGITARVRWGGSRDRRGRPRWIHATPLMGGDGKVGVWMVVLTDDEGMN